MKSALERSGRGLVIATPFALLAAALLLSTAVRAVPTEVGTGDRLAFAITGARVIALPGRVFDPGTVVVRGGVIEAVGPAGTTAIPPDARVFDRKGRVVHAAFVDPYVPVDRLAGRRPRVPIDDEEAGEGTTPPGRGSGAA
ncbi:MAG: hypothetical protein M3167_17520, partial [Acidobacteriota bacterium]|nr:hypothetical protein [Acidobacteriota bacterium]